MRLSLSSAKSKSNLSDALHSCRADAGRAMGWGGMGWDGIDA
jgi:hypothetical protein